MKHHINKVEKNQQEFLINIPEDSERLIHAQLFRIGNAALHYHQQASINSEPTEEDFSEWLEGLPKHIAVKLKESGLQKCKTHFPFTRYLMEKQDVGMDAWMRKNLSEEDFTHWKKQA
ncbi:MAG: hypothetical protein JXQ90_18515 [Cyclobacteriaceae bacterium]